MASTHKHIRSSTASKRPTTAIAEGQIALNTNAASPGLFFKDSTGASIIKVGPVHVGTTAPNATPAAGGSSGNSTGEVWLDTSLTPVGVKIWNGSAWVNATPVGSTTVQGLLNLATNAETQTGSDTARAVTPAGLQSKVSDSTSTTSSTTIASSTAVKAAYDLANAALPKAGGTVTGALEIGSAGSLVFEGATADDFETTLGAVDPTADRSILLPDVNGTIITTGDTGTVTSGMIADGTIVNADISGSAEIAVSKLADGAARQVLQTDAAGTGVEWTDSVALPGSATATSFSPTGSSVPTNGFYLPTTNSVAISTNGTGRLFIDASGNIGLGISPSTKFHVYQTGSTQAGLVETNQSASVINFKSTGQSSGQPQIGCAASDLILNTNGSERARLDSSGRLGLGTSSPTAGLTIYDQYAPEINLNQQTWGTVGRIFGNADGVSIYAAGSSKQLRFFTDATRAMTIDSSQRVGIGTTSPGSYSYSDLVVTGATGGMSIVTGTSDTGRLVFADGVAGVGAFRGAVQYDHSVDSLIFAANGAEKSRIDSSGRLLVGTSSSRGGWWNTTGIDSAVQVEATNQWCFSAVNNINNSNGPWINIGKSRGTTVGSTTVVQSGDQLGGISFQGADGSELVTAAAIQAFVDGTPGANDMPGRLVFSTTADGSASPTARMTIQNDGDFILPDLYNRTSASGRSVLIQSNGLLVASTSSIRYKTSVEPIDENYSTALLKLQPVWYRSTCKGDNPEFSYWGFIAEDVAKVDPRLVIWGTEKSVVDENCERKIVKLTEPVADGVAYDRFVPHLLNLIKRQKEQIEAQGTAIAALEARLSALEAS